MYRIRFKPDFYETRKCGAGGVYLSSGREKSGFSRVDSKLCPNQISE